MDHSKKPGMAFKIDISKAYDRVSWSFLFVVLRKLGIEGRFLKMIYACVTSPMCSILVNGVPQGFFSCSRGLRQGDPLSPYLFIIVVEVLGRNIQKLVDSKALKGVKVTSALRPDSHQQFVDDTLMFRKALVGEAGLWKYVLNDYALVSGQCINYEKIKIYFFNIDQQIKDRVVKKMGCQEASLPNSYLGLPLISMKLENNY